MSAQAPTDAHLMGQESDGAKAAVRAQRDLKRKKDSLRKLEKKMKSMKADDASYAEAAAECRALKEEIDALEAAVGDTSAGVKSGAAAKKAAEKVEAEPARRNDKLKPQAKCGADAAADGGAGREAAPLG
ncbi:translation initiation factor eIF2B delta subunit, partial [Trypanosoma grayi]|uniref:translation initiation factor eIF2B delta subunit n=1 Tax=Trypanosoma grayi TaxID=71804 RepID=UPI0004F40916